MNGSLSPDAAPTRPWLGLAIALTVTLMLVGSEVAADTDAATEVGIAASIILVALISGLMVAKRPRHPISWLLTFAAFSGGLAGVSAELLPSGLTEMTWWQSVLAVISSPAWYGLLFTVLVLIPLLFPTGSPTTPRWRWVGVARWRCLRPHVADGDDSGVLLHRPELRKPGLPD